MKSFSTAFAVLSGVVLVAATASRGATVSHLSIPGTTRVITDVTGFRTTGEDMGGMRVTAFFTPDLLGASETVNWNPGVAGSLAGSAVGTGWRLDESGDTWNSPWRLSADTGTNLTLYGLKLEGFLESNDPVSDRATVFDRTDPFFGTDGSYRGRDLDALAMAGSWSHVRVVYSDQVESLAHVAPPTSPVGDIYRAMQLQFGNLIPSDPLPIFEPVPFVAGNELLYMQDADTVGPRVPGDPGDEGSPEPASALLLLIGLAAAGPRFMRASRCSDKN
jgi:hypothetical protein